MGVSPKLVWSFPARTYLLAMGKILKADQLVQIARLLVLALVTSLLTLQPAQPGHATHTQPYLINNLQVKDEFGQNASDSALLEIFPEFHPNEFEYYMYIGNTDFNFIDFELELPSNVYLDQTLQVTCTRSGLNAPSSYPFPNPVDLRLSESMMVDSCGGSFTPAGAATVTFKLYDLDDWQNLVPGLTPDSTYTINIIRKLGNDVMNFDFSIQDDNGAYSPNGPAIVSNRKWHRFPSGDGYSKSGFIFDGWKDQDTNQVYQPGNTFLMDRAFTVRVNWLEDVPDGTITIEGTTFDVGDEPVSFIAVDGASEEFLSYSVNATGHYNVMMWTGYDYISSGADPDSASAYFSSQDVGLSGTPTELPYNLDCDTSGTGYFSCNVLILAVEIFSPSGADSELKIFAIMVRTAGQSEYCATFYNSDSPNNSEPIQNCSISQGWIQLAGYKTEWDRDDIPPDRRFLEYFDWDAEQNFYMLDYQVSSSAAPLPIATRYYPLFESEEFVGQWLLDEAPLPLSINLFGNVFTPELCDELNPPQGEPPFQELCLVQTLDGDISSSHEIVHRAAAGNYYVALEFLPTDPTFPNSYSITADVTGATAARLTVEGFEAFTIATDEAYQDELTFGETGLEISAPGSENCLEGFCSSIYSVGLIVGSYTGDSYEEMNISVIRLQDNDTASHSISFDSNGGTGTPPAAISGTRGWVSPPSTSGLAKVGFLPVGWSVDPVGTNPWYSTNKIPLVESRTLYALWLDSRQVNFYKSASDSQPYLSLEQLLGWFEGSVPNPTSSGQVFVGWSVTSDGSELVDLEQLFIVVNTNLYAVWSSSEAVNANSNSGNQPVSTRPSTASNTPTDSVATTPETKPKRISFAIQRVNGRTLLKATVPAKYSNQNATIEVKRWSRGKVRYFVIGKTRSVLEATDSVLAKLAFDFKLKLRPTDTFRIKVGPTQVIKAKVGK